MTESMANFVRYSGRMFQLSGDLRRPNCIDYIVILVVAIPLTYKLPFNVVFLIFNAKIKTASGYNICYDNGLNELSQDIYHLFE